MEKTLKFCIFIADYQSVIMKTKDSKVSHKSSDLTSVLVQHFGKSLNLARIKFMSLFICALCKVQVVCFEKLASGFENSCSPESSLRRIQRFMADYKLDKDLIARLIFALLPHEPPYSIAIDRIEKLVALITIAFCWAYLVGIYLHEHEKPIRILNNGRMAKSFFKYGLTFIASVLLNAGFQSDIDIFKFLSCT